MSLPYRLFGVGSIHLRGGESFLVLLLFFDALAALYTPCMLCGSLPLFLCISCLLIKKKKNTLVFNEPFRNQLTYLCLCGLRPFLG